MMHISHLSVLYSLSILNGIQADGFYGRYDRRLVPRQESTLELSFSPYAASPLSKRISSDCPVCKTESKLCSSCAQLQDAYIDFGPETPPPSSLMADSQSNIPQANIPQANIPQANIPQANIPQAHTRNTQQPETQASSSSGVKKRKPASQAKGSRVPPGIAQTGMSGVDTPKATVTRTTPCDAKTNTADRHPCQQPVWSGRCGHHPLKLTFYEENFIEAVIQNPNSEIPSENSGKCDVWVAESKRRCGLDPLGSSCLCEPHSKIDRVVPVWSKDSVWRSHVIEHLNRVKSHGKSREIRRTSATQLKALETYFEKYPIISQA